MTGLGGGVGDDRPGRTYGVAVGVGMTDGAAMAVIVRANSKTRDKTAIHIKLFTVPSLLIGG